MEADNVYEVLPSLTAPAAVREESLQDEKDKAEIINKDIANKVRIQHLEDLDIFKGSIHNVIGLLTDSNEDYTNVFESIFAEDNTVLVNVHCFQYRITVSGLVEVHKVIEFILEQKEIIRWLST